MKEPRPRKTPAAVCRRCGKLVRVRPAGGDWLNEIRFISHDVQGGLCQGSFMPVKDADIRWSVELNATKR